MAAAKASHILLVDDDLSRAKAMTRVLARAGYVVRVAQTAEQGLELVGVEPHPDLVLMDVVLPGISGIEACRRICERALEKSPPVLLISALATDSVQQAEGLEAGAVGYIALPISMRELKARVSAALGKNQQHRREDGPELSPRQLEVLAWIAEGLSTKEIAVKLGITVRTAETHRAAIRRRLQLPSSLLVRYAVERGITPQPPGHAVARRAPQVPGNEDSHAE